MNTQTNKKSWSMVQKLVFSSMVLLMLLGAINGVQFKGVANKVKKADMEALSANTDSLEHAISAQFYERYGDVQAFALNDQLYGDNSEKMSEILNNYAALYGIYDVIAVLDTEGNVISANTKGAEGNKININKFAHHNFANEQWFKNVSNGKFTEDKEHGLVGTLYGEPTFNELIKEAYGQERYTNVFATMRKNEKGVKRIFVNFANFKWVENEFTSFAKMFEESDLKSVELTLINKDGFIVTEYDNLNNKEYLVKHDANIFGKFNLFEKVPAIKKLADEHRDEVVETYHARKKYNVLSSIHKFEDEKIVKDLSWYIVARVQTDDVLATINAATKEFYAILIGSMILFSLFTWVYYKKYGKHFVEIANVLKGTVTTSTRLGSEINEAANAQAAAASEQAAAIQESASALSEMLSMISKTADNSKKSLDSATVVTERTTAGKEIMNKMTSAMSEIEKSNASIQEIAAIIQDINAKTSVINDIVFKTQLLSFNASIEAARAGQYGKGFAVVAEEVGNLAQMSGSAAKEIESLLVDSQRKVATTLEMIRQRVKEGNIVNDEAVRTFNEIASSITDISGQIKNIAEAAQQQSVGIEQTQKAIGQLDIVARQNAEASQKALTQATDLKNASNDLSGSSNQLQLLVNGKIDDGSVTEHPQSKTKKVIDLIKYKNEEKKEVKITEKTLSSNEITADDDSFKNAA